MRDALELIGEVDLVKIVRGIARGKERRAIARDRISRTMQCDDFSLDSMEPNEATLKHATRAWRETVGHLAAIVYASEQARTALAERFKTEIGRGATGQVYFIGQGFDGPVKIGTSTRVAARMSSLQIGCAAKLHLLATIPGDRSVEQTLHGIFAADGVGGEWFARSEALADFIRALRAPRPKYPHG